jgi:hypothetical protein
MTPVVGRIPSASSGPRVEGVDAFRQPGPFRRRWRRSRSASFGDPLSKGLITLLAATVATVVGARALQAGSTVAAVPVLLAALLLGMEHLRVVVQALKRDKAVTYWTERQQLQLQLQRLEAQQELLTTALTWVHELDRERSRTQPLQKLSALMDEVFDVLTASHDDVALILALEADDCYWILNSTISAGSRWDELRPGKRCDSHGEIDQTLKALAPDHHYAFPVETAQGRLWMIALSSTEVVQEDIKVFNELRLCLALLADRWEPGKPTQPVALRSVS